MTEPIRFLLNGAPVEVTGVAPQVTLLQYLRETRGLTGTKEGCAEGDCGACTVVLASRNGEHLDWQPVNACIRLLPSVDGKAIFTVESLRAADGTLHPVQQAMVEAHGSQCGFCTPGFVMSLFALYKQVRAPSRQVICDALSGNLCRCTGYRPIVAAASTMGSLPPPDDWRAPARAPDSTHAVAAAEAGLARALGTLSRTATFDYAAAGQRWRAPRTLEALTALCEQRPDARLIAGATDLGLWVTKQHRDLGDMIYVGDVGELCAVTRAPDGGVVIGAAVNLEQAFAALDATYPELHEAWMRFASPPIRASGTLGGNIANGSPIGDSMPALIALRARVTLACVGGTRELALEDFYAGYQRTVRMPGEVLVDVRIPARPPNLVLRAYKISKRYDQDISAVFACFALERDDHGIAEACIGCGGVAPVPARAPGTEAMLRGQPWRHETFRAAAAGLATEFTPIDDLRASAAYRRTALGNLVERLWLDADGPGTAPIRIEDVAISMDAA